MITGASSEPRTKSVGESEGMENIIADFLRDFRAADAAETQSAARLLEFVQAQSGAFAGREIMGAIGHVVGAAWIRNVETSSVLLVLGVKERAWKLPGTHSEVEDDTDLLACACREATRALGQPLSTKSAPLFAVCEQLIPAYWNTPSHLHFEMIFRFEAPQNAVDAALLPRGAKWFPLEEAALLSNESVARCVRKTQITIRNSKK